jgi:uncharacterized protein (TIGR03086 family)
VTGDAAGDGQDVVTARVLLPKAAAVFTGLVHEVPADGWAAPTPCAQWSVRDLVAHLTREHLWVPDLLSGRTVEEVGDAYEGDVLGDDPVAAWSAAVAESLSRWDRTGDEVVVHLSSGPTRAGRYAEEMLLDLVVHGWDLARGLGVRARLNPAMVSHVLAYAEQNREELTSSAMFAALAEVEPPDGDPQARLLTLLGRSPTWSA